MRKAVIIGAGEAGKMVAREILDSSRLSKSYTLAGFLDDDPGKKSVWGVPVLGVLSDSAEIIRREEIQVAIIAIPSASREVMTRLITTLSGTSAEIRVVPGIDEILQGTVSWKQIRPVQPQDLLGREEVGFDEKEITEFYHDQTIFVTGAGGSIGSEIFRQILRLPVRKAYALGRGENSIHQLFLASGKDPRFHYLIGDAGNFSKIRYELSQACPDTVFHAAAHKHVPMMEEFPEEAVRNNVLGTFSAALAALESGVKTFVLVSTDKAVNPTSVMGCTKRLAEKIVLSLNGRGKTRFICTRFGNVLGSRGSVIPTFLSQIERGGPVTVTHPEMERYFMSIPEAARLVIKAPCAPQGDIFVLNMGRPVKILELARNLIRLTGHDEDEIPVIFTGLRKGEKIHEELFSERENLKATAFEKLMILEKAPEIFSADQLENLRKELSFACETYDRNQIRSLLANYVPEFQGKTGQE